MTALDLPSKCRQILSTDRVDFMIATFVRPKNAYALLPAKFPGRRESLGTETRWRDKTDNQYNPRTERTCTFVRAA